MCVDLVYVAINNHRGSTPCALLAIDNEGTLNRNFLFSCKHKCTSSTQWHCHVPCVYVHTCPAKVLKVTPRFHCTCTDVVANALLPSMFFMVHVHKPGVYSAYQKDTCPPLSLSYSASKPSLYLTVFSRAKWSQILPYVNPLLMAFTHIFGKLKTHVGLVASPFCPVL